jgi:hypothetical protein
MKEVLFSLKEYLLSFVEIIFSTSVDLFVSFGDVVKPFIASHLFCLRGSSRLFA